MWFKPSEQLSTTQLLFLSLYQKFKIQHYMSYYEENKLTLSCPKQEHIIAMLFCLIKEQVHSFPKIEVTSSIPSILHHGF